MTMRLERVLFLDIDGVLNSRRSAIALGNYPNPYTIEKDLHLFDDLALRLVRLFCRNNDVKIVWSSTWRTIGCARLNTALDLPGIDVTRSTRADEVRGEQIQDWIDKFRPERYAILDDDSDMLRHQMPFLVQTDGMEGLTLSNVESIAKILETADWFLTDRK